MIQVIRHVSFFSSGLIAGQLMLGHRDHLDEPLFHGRSAPESRMAAIAKRGEKWWVSVRRVGIPTPTGTFETKGAARRWARQVELDMDQGRVAGRVATGTVGDLLDR
ncbi:MAG: hypothetical protein AAFX81_11890 [Pseudomonadota bacterium]